MKAIYASILLFPLPLVADVGNPAIDYGGFQKMTADVGKLRAERRVSEADFLQRLLDEQVLVS